MKFINDRREMRSQSGFTLIELLVVIAILGILAAVVVFAIGGVTDNGQVAACKLEARTVKTAIQAYRAQKNEYPDIDADLFGGEFLEAANSADLKLVAITWHPAAAGPPATPLLKPTLDWQNSCTEAGTGVAVAGTNDPIAGLTALP